MKNTYESLGVGRRVEGCRVVRVIDDGNNGGIFKVRKLGSVFTYALKTFRGLQSPERIGEFREEAQFAVGDELADYKPKCVAAKIEKDEIWFVMERVGRFPKKLRLRLLVRHLSRVAEALGELHRLGRIHCDVKPGNMGVLRGLAVLIDFGCMQSFEKAANDPKFFGTWDYMAPEMKRGERFDWRVDVYSLGKTLEVLCPDRCLRIFLPVIVRATAESRGDRFQTMAEFRRALEDCERNYLRDMAVASRLVKFGRVVKTMGKVLVCSTVAFLLVMGTIYTGKYICNWHLSGEHIVEEIDFEKSEVLSKLGAYANEIRLLERIAISDSRYSAQACDILSRRCRCGRGCERSMTASVFWAERAVRARERWARRLTGSPSSH